MERNLNNLEDFHAKVLTTRVLVRGGFCGGMHAVLGDFVDAAKRLFLMKAEELVQRTCTFADLIRLLDCLGHIGLCQDYSLAELLAACQLRQDRG